MKQAFFVFAIVVLEACGSAGSTGNQGKQGAAGTAAIIAYGDGSAGAKNIVGDGGFFTDDNLQYTDFTVADGGFLFVQSGAVIHCTGTFTNNGTIWVDGNWGNYNSGFAYGNTSNPPLPSFSGSIAGPGEFAANGVEAIGGPGGNGVSVWGAAQVLFPGLNGGGSGYSDSVASATGGGSFVVFAQGPISIGAGGLLEADGEATGPSASSGGGGGVIVLASATSVTQLGTISAKGASGTDATTANGANGGGGGGIIHFLAPTLAVDAGTNLVSGGLGGLGDATIVTGTTGRFAGMGAGGSGGLGGFGGNISASNVAANANNGAFGYVISDVLDPTDLYR